MVGKDTKISHSMNRYIRPRAAILAGSLAFLIPGGHALGQVDTRSSAPIDITADQGEVDNTKCVAVWRGAAEALQGDTRLRADTITVYSHPKGAGANGQPSCGGTDRIVADGHVYYVTPQQHVRGDRAVYTEGSDEIVVTGDVIVVQGDDVARGEKLTIDTNTHVATMVGQTTGAGQLGRARGVFYPNNNNTTGKAGSAQGAATAVTPGAPTTPPSTP